MEGLELVWGWQPAAYLFLGGLGAGTFATAAVLFLKDRQQAKWPINIAMWASIACLGVGLLFLVTELIHPLRGMMLWQSFSNFGSWMTFGAWAAFAAMIVFAIAALITCPAIQEKWGKRPSGASAEEGPRTGAAEPPAAAGESGPAALRDSRIAAVAIVIGLILALCVAAYTGVLLMSAPGVPLWNSSFLPLLFTVSALDTGVALMELIALPAKEGLSHRSERGLGIAVVVLVALESVFLAALMTTSLGAEPGSAAGAATVAAAQSLISGGFAPVFWTVFVGLGLVAPLLGACIGLARSSSRAIATALGAAGALIGGCALRFLIVFAGTHADYIAQTVASLVF